MKKSDKQPDSPCFDFSGAIERYKKSDDTLYHFCIDEMMAYFISGWNDKNRLEDTPENRRMYYEAIRNHLTKRNAKTNDRKKGTGSP